MRQRYLDLLGLPASASRAQIEHRLNEEERKWHHRINSAPDVFKQAECQRHIDELAEAHKVLLEGAPDGGESDENTIDDSHLPPRPPLPPAPPPRSLQLASFASRLTAGFLDTALCLATCFVGWAVWSLVLLNRGQTPGKRLVRTEVRRVTGEPINGGTMFLREFILKGALAATIVLTHGLGLLLLLWPLWDKQRQALYDKLCGTIVVYASETEQHHRRNGWWQAWDGNWYPPEQHPSRTRY
jgi:uncharacterized RDD family membrane protein YckC